MVSRLEKVLVSNYYSNYLSTLYYFLQKELPTINAKNKTANMLCTRRLYGRQEIPRKVANVIIISRRDVTPTSDSGFNMPNMNVLIPLHPI